MGKYLDEDCRNCDEYIEPYGCTWHECPIYKAVQEFRAEEEYDRRRDDTVGRQTHPIFDGILDNIEGKI